MRVRVLIGLAALLLAVLAWRLLAPPAHGDALAWTECPVGAGPRVTLSDRIEPRDTFPVRVHEQVHVGQCRDLGPWRYRIRNVTSRGRLSLEAPGYCAGAAARLAQGEDTALVRERLVDDAEAAFPRLARSGEVRQALRLSCDGLVH